MGLDMYLRRVPASWVRGDTVSRDIGVRGIPGTADIGYWRKAYGLYDWMVSHGRNIGKDTYEISRESIDSLLTSMREMARGLRLYHDRTIEDGLPEGWKPADRGIAPDLDSGHVAEIEADFRVSVEHPVEFEYIDQISPYPDYTILKTLNTLKDVIDEWDDNHAIIFIASY